MREFNLCINVADALEDQVLKAAIFLNDPTFRQTHYVCKRALDRFKIKYFGRGRLCEVLIYVCKKDNSIDTLYFKTCDILQLKGQSIAAH
jgi:hypothetical protein